jgi:hypothetical protein
MAFEIGVENSVGRIYCLPFAFAVPTTDSMKHHFTIARRASALYSLGRRQEFHNAKPREIASN